MRLIVMLLLLCTGLQAKELEDFQLPHFESEKKFQLSEVLKKKKVVLNFWASWCTACIQELPELRELKEKHKENFVFVAVNAGEESFKIKKFLDKYDFPYTILHDKKREISKRLGVLSLPQTLVIGKNREILYRGDRPPEKL